MKLIYDLIAALHNVNQSFEGISYSDKDGLFTVYVHDPKLARKHGWNKPNLEYCRDRRDYNLLYRQWKQKGTYVLYIGEDLNEVLQKSLDKLAVAT